MRWSASIALSLVASSVAFGGQQSSSPPDAETLYNTTIAPYAGSREGVQNRLVTPLMKDGQLSTVDEKKTFTVNSLQPSGAPVLRVTAFLNPGTGDLAKVTVEQNLSGGSVMDTASVYPYDGNGKMISGVCANGYIQCDPGTYSNCQFRQWTVDPQGQIGAEVSGALPGSTDAAGSISGLSSCYCFNQTCAQYGNSAVLNIDPIVSDLGGGIVSMFLSARRDLAITSTSDNGTGVISYFAVKAQGGTTGTTNYSSPSMPIIPSTDVVDVQSTFDSNPSYLDASSTTMMQQQTQSPNSLYNIVSSAMSNQSGQTFTCTNRRTATISVNTSTTSRSAGSVLSDPSTYVYTCADDRGSVVLNQVNGGTFALGFQGYGPNWNGLGGNCPPIDRAFVTSLNAQGQLLDTFSLPAATVGDLANYHITQLSVSVQIVGGGCAASGINELVWLPTQPMNTPLITHSSLYCPARGAQYPVALWTWSATYQQQLLQEAVDDGCASYENDKTCKLQQEVWDGRPVVMGFTPTGFQLYEVCRDIPGPLRNAHVCHDWWQQDKTYICQRTQTVYNFDQVRRRIKGVQDSSNMPGKATLEYADGGQTLTYGTFPKGDLPDCPQICKTKKSFSASLITVTNPKSAFQTSAATAGSEWKYFYKECTQSAQGNYTCLADASSGEIVVKDCACNGDFGDAVSALDAVNNAVQDAICSPN